MNTAIYILGGLGGVVLILLIIVSSLPSPTVRQILKRLQRRDTNKNP